MFLKVCYFFLHSLSNGVVGKEPGTNLDEQDAWTTKLSGVGCEERNRGSTGAGLYLLAILRDTAGAEVGFSHTASIGSVRA